MTDCKTTDGNSFNCSCKSGYKTKRFYQPFKTEDSYIHVCEDIDECLKPFSCPNNTTCMNTVGSYECFCEAGFKPSFESVKTDGCIAVCEPNPCGRNGICKQHLNHGYICICDGAYIGAFCNVTNEVLENLKLSNLRTISLVGGILSALLIIVLVTAFIVYIKKYKKFQKRNNDELRYKGLAFLDNKVLFGCSPKSNKGKNETKHSEFAGNIEELEMSGKTIDLSSRNELSSSQQTLSVENNKGYKKNQLETNHSRLKTIKNESVKISTSL